MEFPTQYKQLRTGYSVIPDDGTVANRADNGLMRVQRLYPVTRYNITFRIGPLTAQDVIDIREFYALNRNLIDMWTDSYTGIIYNIVMLGEPRIVQVEYNASVMEIRMDGEPA